MSSRIEQTGPGEFRLVGELSYRSVNALLAESERLLAGGGTIHLDLAGVTRADSAGLALLLEWRSAARKRGLELGFEHLPDGLVQIARACNVTPLLPDAPEEDG